MAGNGSPQVSHTPDSKLQAIKSQVEYYFSRENLAVDQYLVGQMNSQYFVPLVTLAGFGKLQRLGATVEAVSYTHLTLPTTPYV